VSGKNKRATKVDQHKDDAPCVRGTLRRIKLNNGNSCLVSDLAETKPYFSNAAYLHKLQSRLCLAHYIHLILKQNTLKTQEAQLSERDRAMIHAMFNISLYSAFYSHTIGRCQPSAIFDYYLTILETIQDMA